MSDPYERAKGGKLTFKGGIPLKSTDKHKKKRKKSKKVEEDLANEAFDAGDASSKDGTGDIYTIDPMKRMKYDELFPVEAKKFGYEGREKSKSVEEALDDRVKKKADRYCKYKPWRTYKGVPYETCGSHAFQMKWVALVCFHLEMMRWLYWFVRKAYLKYNGKFRPIRNARYLNVEKLLLTK